jgi:hypothetical protein
MVKLKASKAHEKNLPVKVVRPSPISLSAIDGGDGYDDVNSIRREPRGDPGSKAFKLIEYKLDVPESVNPRGHQAFLDGSTIPLLEVHANPERKQLVRGAFAAVFKVG